MICILHGYLLEGSGSNLWTRSVVDALCRQGETVHLMAQENHPDRYPWISEAWHHHDDGRAELFHRHASPYPGHCILHKPVIGDTLPVFVHDEYEEFEHAVPLVDLPDAAIDEYVALNARILERIVRQHGISALHGNHNLMPEVAQRVHSATGVPYSVMLHGSELEYAIKREERFRRRAACSIASAGAVFVHGEEMEMRVRDALGPVTGIDAKFRVLHLGVDTSEFEPAQPSERAVRIERLKEALHELPRGRTPAQRDAMLDRLHGRMSESELLDAFALARSYDGKLPDRALEVLLEPVQWEREKILMFAGRLISTKGIHGVIAALPYLLAENPTMRLVVVGHGPLREPLEAMLWAMEHGESELLELIVARGRVLEGSPQGDTGGTALTSAALFLDQLRGTGELTKYMELARTHVRPDRVIFTGYLTHRELRHLFPCADAAVFPSVVKEAGPLVFLEALASGAYPLGTYFGGMRASIESVAEHLAAGDADAMRLRPGPEHTVTDIVRQVPRAFEKSGALRDNLHQIAASRYDWSSVARRMISIMEAL